MLSIKNVSVFFGGLTAVNNISLEIPENSIFAIIGPNGAGKTTLFNVITGVYDPSRGSVSAFGKNLEESFTLRTFFKIITFGIYTALFSLVALNLPTLWEIAIKGLYVYQEPFRYSEALITAYDYLANNGAWTYGPLLFGTLLGILAGLSSFLEARYSTEASSRAGLARTFQNIRLFQDLSVRENVLVAMDKHCRGGYWSAVFRLPIYFRERKKSEKEADKLLEFVGLAGRQNQNAASLPYGLQRRLEIARALATEPRIILLDEPAAGMNASESADLMALLRKIRALGKTVVFIEHDMQVVMEVSDRIAVLNYGNMIAVGTPEEVRANPKVVEAYLGASAPS